MDDLLFFLFPVAQQENQNYDKMDFQDRLKMSEQCGKDLRKLIHTYTNLDTTKIEDFI